jgi:hypothetical protein
MSYRNIASFSVLRQYFIIRLAADTVLILPIVVYYKLRSATYTYNYIIVIITLVISELVIMLKNTKNLYKKSIVEIIEGLQDGQELDFISHFNSRSRSFVAYVNTWRAA